MRRFAWMLMIALVAALPAAAERPLCDMNGDGVCDLADDAIWQQVLTTMNDCYLAARAAAEATPTPTPTPSPSPTPTPTPTPTPPPDPEFADPMSTASRTSGVAPLVVHFDATSMGGDLHGSHYVWDFDDPGSGAWHNGRSRNTATGFVAAHVFETPGTYVVTLGLTRPNGVHTDHAQTITVQEFAGATFYVASNGSDANPGDINRPFKTVARAAAAAGPNTRILFRRGDTFAAGGFNWVCSGPGPTAVGAYGSGAAPVITWSAGDGITLAAGLADWRISDLQLRSAGGRYGVLQPGNVRDVLIQRCVISGWNHGVVNAETGAGNLAQRLAIADCEFRSNQVRAGWIGANGLMLMGNRMVGHQQTRVFYSSRGVIAHNDMQGGQTASNGNTFKCQGAEQIGEVRYLVISDNVFGGDDGGAWPVEVSPQSGQVNEPMRDILIERNVFGGNSTTQVGLILAARDVTVRNNLFIGTGTSAWFDGLAVFKRGAAPAPENVRVIGNTVYCQDLRTEVSLVSISGECRNTQVANNTVCAPAGPQSMRKILKAGGGQGLVYDATTNLVVEAQALTNPTGGDFSPAANGVLSNTGRSVAHMRDDHYGRPRLDQPDIGAVERP